MLSSAMAAARQFLAVAAPEAAAMAPLTMVSYNILADKFATSGWHNYCAPRYLAWQYRAPLILEELLSYNADVLCLQEVERPFFEGELQPLMGRHGYEGLYYGRRVRPTDRIKGPEEGIALLYRTARLVHITSQATRLGDLVEAGRKGEFWGRVRDLGEGAIWALLHDQQVGQPILVGCTHLFWDPRYPDVKVAQAHLLCQAAETLLHRAGLPARYRGSVGGGPTTAGAATAAARGAGGSDAGSIETQGPPLPIPVLLGGDFNSLPAKFASDDFDTVLQGSRLVSGVYTLLSKGRLGPGHPDHPASRRPGDEGGLEQVVFTTGGLRLCSVLAAAWGAEPPITNHTASFSGCLDYLWASQQHWQPVAALEMPYSWEATSVPAAAGAAEAAEQQLGEGRGGGQAGVAGAAAADPAAVAGRLPPMPNDRFPSDHLAVGAQLALRS